MKKRKKELSTTQEFETKHAAQTILGSPLNLRWTRDYVDPPTGQVPDEVAADCDPDACSGQAVSALGAVAF